MSLINFSDWRASLDESSPLTRQRDQWGRYGNYPVRADFMSRSTPLPAFVDKLKKELGTPEHPKKRKKRKKHKKHKCCEENFEYLDEARKAPQLVHRDMESWLQELEALKKDLNDLKDAKNKAEKKTIETKKRALELARKKRDEFVAKRDEPKEEDKKKEKSQPPEPSEKNKQKDDENSNKNRRKKQFSSKTKDVE
jgi:hypothetical protein